MSSLCAKKAHRLLLFFGLFFPIVLFCFWEHSTSFDMSCASYRTKLLDEMKQASSFDSFTNALFCYEITSDSVSTAYMLRNPSDFQIPSLHPKISSFSFDTYQKKTNTHQDQALLSFLSNQLSRFSKYPLDTSDQYTYDLIEYHLSLQQALCDYPYYEELLGSSTGVSANLPITLGEYPLHDEQDIKIYFSLLKQIPDYFDDVIEYETYRNRLGYKAPLFLRAATATNLKKTLDGFEKGDNSFIDTFHDRLLHIDSLSKSKQNIYEKRNQHYVTSYVIPAYEKLYSYLENEVSKASQNTKQSNSKSTPLLPDANTTYGLCSLPKGADYYALLTKSATGSSHSPEELIQMTDQALADALGTVLNIALTDQKTYIYYCENPLESYYESPQSILESLSLLSRKDFPLLEETPTYHVKTVSDSLAQSLSPAFYMIPAIDDYQNNTIYINPLYTNAENGNLFTTLAHEGFPGHLYQTVYFNNTHPSPIRQTLNYPGYVEGWATYTELYSFTFLDYPKAPDTLCKLYQADTIISLALSSRIDLGVNYEGWTLTDVQNYFEKQGFQSYYATDLYSYVVEAPANYLSYFIGYLEIQDIKDAYLKAQPTLTEKDFHKAFLDLGPSDFETLRNHLLHSDTP